MIPNESGHTLVSRSMGLLPADRAHTDALEHAVWVEVDSCRTINDIWDTLRQHEFQIIAISLFGLVMGLGSVFLLPRIYEARTALQIEGINENYLNLRDLEPTAPASPYGAETYIQTQIKLLRSESLARRVIEKLRLSERADFKDTSRFDRRLVPRPVAASNPKEDSILNKLREALDVRSSLQSRLVELTFRAKDPVFAATAANTFAQEYITENLESRAQRMQRTLQWLNEEIAALQQRLQQQNAEAEHFARASGLIVTADNSNLAEVGLRELQTEISHAEGERATKQSQYEAAMAASIESVPQILDNQTLVNYRTNLTNLRRELAESRVLLTPEHYKVQRIEAQIAELESNFERERGNVVKRIHEEYDAAQLREELLLKLYATQADALAQQSVKMAHYNILRREIQTGQQLNDAMVQKSIEARIAMALQSTNIRVVDIARVPSSPESPKPIVNSALGLLSGLIVGLAIAMGRKRPETTFKKPGEVAKFLKLPELGVIPAANIDDGFGKQAFHVLGLRATPREPVELATWNLESTQIGDSFRSALGSIFFSASNRNRPKVVVVSSVNSSEGKTTVSTNLGIAGAQMSCRTLLIDADLRRPRLHKIFGLCNRFGLSDLLAGDQAIQDIPAEMIAQPSKIDGLSILMSGPGIAGPSNLFFSNRLEELLNYLREHFALIVIDSPPMLRFPDSRALSVLSDGVVVVVRASQTTHEQLELARLRLIADRVPLLGTILNDWIPTSMSDRYYYKHGVPYPGTAR